MTAYDAFLLVSFGGPESMDDVMPFLENVLRGRNAPPERVREVARHYEHFGGVSPLNDANRKLIKSLEREFAGAGIELPIYWGNRNWHPLLGATMEEMAQAGVRRALAFVTSAYSSYASCRQYLEDIERARVAVGARAPVVDKLPAFYNHPEFVQANIDQVKAAMDAIPSERKDECALVFTAHSIPAAMAATASYEAQLRETALLIARAIGKETFQLAYQSRSGPPSQPWLEPDILDCLRALKGAGTDCVVVAPIGFVADHMEVLYDLDTEAKGLAAQLGLTMVRTSTAGTHPRFVTMIRELVSQWSAMDETEVPACLPDCCAYVPQRRPL